MWPSEVPGVRGRGAGKSMRYLGVFLICTGVANLVRGVEGISAVILLPVFGALCMALAKGIKKAANDANRRKDALCRGEYLVAPAECVDLRTGNYHQVAAACADVILPDGQRISPQIPYACARELLGEGIHQTSVLLIQIPGDPNVLAIPCGRE